jgi:hypothetical protein
MKSQQTNLEIELEDITRAMEIDPEYAFLQGKTGTPIQDEKQVDANARILLDEKLIS